MQDIRGSIERHKKSNKTGEEIAEYPKDEIPIVVDNIIYHAVETLEPERVLELAKIIAETLNKKLGEEVRVVVIDEGYSSSPQKRGKFHGLAKPGVVHFNYNQDRR